MFVRARIGVFDFILSPKLPTTLLSYDDVALYLRSVFVSSRGKCARESFMRGRGHFGGKRETTKEMRGRKKKRDDAEKTR